VSGVSAFLDFDPTYLEVQAITPGTTLPTVLQNVFDNNAGTIDYSAGKLGAPFPSGTFTVVTITFLAKAAVDTTSIAFHTEFPRETNADYGGTSVLRSASGVTVTIVVAGPNIAVSPQTKDFGAVAVGSTAGPEVFNVTSTGTEDLVVGTISLGGPDAGEFAIQNDNVSGQTLAPGQSATFEVIFSPTSEGAKSAEVSIPSNGPTATVALSGTGTVPDIDVSPTSLDFGVVVPGLTKLMNVTVANVGSAQLNVTAISDPGDPFAVTAPAMPFTINPGDLQTLTVAFSPTAEGDFTGSFTISSNDPDEPQVTVDLTGKGQYIRYTLTVTVEPDGSGTVGLAPAQPAEGYLKDTEVTLTATPAEGYTFKEWTGDVTGTDPTTTIVMDSDKSVTAHFLRKTAIVEAKAIPGMVSLFGDWPTRPFNSPFGPGWTNLVVKTAGNVTAVTVDLKSLLLAMLPLDIGTRIVNQTAWQDLLSTWENVSLEYDADGGFWRLPKRDGEWQPFYLGELFLKLPQCLPPSQTLETIFEELNLGNFSIPVTATGPAGTDTGEIPITIVDTQLPVNRGWSIGSVPIALDSQYDTLGKINTLGDGLVNYIALRYDPQTGWWQQLSPDEALNPLEAFYFWFEGRDALPGIMSRTATPTPARQLYAGWNLVGSAPDFLKYFDVTFHNLRGLMPVDEALVTAYVAPGDKTGYMVVISPGQEIKYREDYYYNGYYLGNGYDWDIAQPGWSYVRDATVPSPEEAMAGNLDGWMTPFGGYWVFMEHDDLLGGFTSTPIPDEWRKKARDIFLGNLPLP